MKKILLFKKKLILATFFFIMSMLSVMLVNAQITYTWGGTTWTPAITVIDPANDVVFSVPTGMTGVVPSGTYEFKTMTVNGNIKFEGGSVTTSGNVDVDSSIFISDDMNFSTTGDFRVGKNIVSDKSVTISATQFYCDSIIAEEDIVINANILSIPLPLKDMFVLSNTGNVSFGGTVNLLTLSVLAPEGSFTYANTILTSKALNISVKGDLLASEDIASSRININITDGALQTGFGILTAGKLTVNAKNGVGSVAYSLDGGGNVSSAQLPLKLNVDTLSASTNSALSGSLPTGEIIVTNDKSLVIDTVTTNGNKGATDKASVVIYAKGPISGNTSVSNNINAWSASLYSTGNTASDNYNISNLNTDLRYFSAIAYDGNININNSSDTLLLFNVKAMKDSTEIMIDSLGNITFKGSTTLPAQSVNITTSGALYLGGIVSAPNTITLTSTNSSILCMGQAAYATSDNLILNANGNIGIDKLTYNAIEMGETYTYSTYFNAYTGSRIDATTNNNGDIFIQGMSRVPVGIIDAGASHSALVAAANKNVYFGYGNSKVSGAKVGLIANNGAIDGNINVSADTLYLSSKFQIGSSSNPVKTNNIKYIFTTTLGPGAETHVTNTGSAFTDISAVTNNGTVNILSTPGASLNFDKTTNIISLSGGTPNLKFINNGGPVISNGLTAGKTLYLEADYISGGSGGVISAGIATLISKSYVGTSANKLKVAFDSLTVTSNSQGIYIDQTARNLTLTATALNPNGNIEITLANNRTLTFDKINAQGDVVLVAGDFKGKTVKAGNYNIYGASLTITSDGNIGSVNGGSLLTNITGYGNYTITNNRENPVININNTGDVTFTAKGTYGYINLNFTNNGNVRLNKIMNGNTINMNIDGALTAVSAGPHIETITSLNLQAYSIGTESQPVKTTVDTFNNIKTTAGGIYIENTITTRPVFVKQITSVGNVWFKASNNIWLYNITAPGQEVEIITNIGYDILDFPVNNTDLNIKARIFKITGRNMGTAADPLELDVNSLVVNLTGEAFTEIASQLNVDANLIQNYAGTISATSIIVSDLGTATLTKAGTLIMKATAGNIVFLNPSNTVDVVGGDIVFESLNCMLPSTESGPAGNIYTCNLRSDGNITLSACHHIGIGELTAGKSVKISANGGFIVDNNGASLNITAGDNIFLTANWHSHDDLLTERATSISDAYIKINTVNQLRQNYEQQSQTQTTTNNLVNDLRNTVNTLQAEVNSKQSEVSALQIAVYAQQAAYKAASVTLNIANTVIAGMEIPAGAAQAVPLTGDGGANAGLAIAKLVVAAAQLVFDLASVSLDVTEGFLSAAEGELTTLEYQLYTNQQNLYIERTKLLNTTNIVNELATLLERAETAKLAAAKLQTLYEQAYAQHNPIGTPNIPLGVIAGKNIDALAKGQSNIFLETPGDMPLGTVTAEGTKNRVYLTAGNNLRMNAGDVVADGSIILCSNGGIVNAASAGRFVADSLMVKTQNSIGAQTSPVQTSVTNLAAEIVSSVIYFENDKVTPLYIKTFEIPAPFTCASSIVGVQKTGAGQVVSIFNPGDIILQAPVVDAQGTVILTSGGAVNGDNIPNHITANTVEISAGSGIGQTSQAINTLAADLDVQTATGDININEVDNINIIEATTDNNSDIYITSGGAVTAVCSPSTEIITGRALNINAINGIGNNCSGVANCYIAPLCNIDTLTAITTNGDIYIANMKGFYINNVSNSTGNATLQTLSGDLAPSNITLSGINPVLSLIAGGAILTPADPYNITADKMILVGDNGTGTLATPLKITANTIAGGTTGTGFYIENLTGDLTIGEITSCATYTGINAGSGNVGISVLNGALLGENGIPTHVTGSAFTANATQNIGTATDPVNTQIDNLNAVSSVSGDIVISETGNVQIDSIYAAAGKMIITATGDINVRSDLFLTDAATLTATDIYFYSTMKANLLPFIVNGNAHFANYAEWYAQVAEFDSLHRSFMTVSGDVHLLPRLLVIADQFANKFYDIIKVGGSVYPPAGGPYANNDSIQRTFVRSYGYGAYYVENTTGNWIRIKSLQVCDTVVDYDQNKYASVGIGSKCWTARNLTSTHYSDGTYAPSHFYYADILYTDSMANLTTYGRLYNYETAMRGATADPAQGICPAGWHIPSKAEATELTNYTADTLKSTLEWLMTGNNRTGFAALPAGFYDYSTDRYFKQQGDMFFWISAPAAGVLSECVNIHFSCPFVLITDFETENGISVRCVKNDPVSFP